MEAWLCRSLALRSRLWNREVSRLAASRSSSSASHSACDRSRALSCDCSSTKASAMPSSLSARSWSRVGCVSIAVFSSMEVTRPTDVVVDYRRLVRGRCEPLAIAVGLQDRVDRAVGSRADLQRPAAGGLQPLGPVALDEPHDADAGAKALLGVRALAQDDLDQRRGFGTDLAGLPRDPLRRPIGVALVARRHVLAQRRVLAVR